MMSDEVIGIPEQTCLCTVISCIEGEDPLTGCCELWKYMKEHAYGNKGILSLEYLAALVKDEKKRQYFKASILLEAPLKT